MLRIGLVIAVAVALQLPYPYADSVNHTEIKRDTPDDGVVLCRLKFLSDRQEAGGFGWRTDWPLAERHLQQRFAEITTARVATHGAGEPVHWIVEPVSAGLRRCPLLLASDVGTLVWRADEVDQMRDYFARGGFLWADDFWGEASWAQLLFAFSQVVPGGSVERLEMDHPVFGMLYRVREVPQISNMNFWMGSGRTDERGDESPEGEVHAGYDSNGHMVALLTFNTDVADAAERESENPDYFDTFALDGYALMINILLYAMSH